MCHVLAVRPGGAPTPPGSEAIVPPRIKSGLSSGSWRKRRAATFWSGTCTRTFVTAVTSAPRAGQNRLSPKQPSKLLLIAVCGVQPLTLLLGAPVAVLVAECLGRRLGGHTGDSYGAALVLTEAITLLLLAGLLGTN